MEAFRDQFTATELLSYKEVLYDEATEEWYAQHDLYAYSLSVLSPMNSFNHQHQV